MPSPSSNPSALDGSSAHPRSGANIQAGTMDSAAGIAPGHIAGSVAVKDAISRKRNYVNAANKVTNLSPLLGSSS